MFMKIVKFFDKLEDKIRGRLSRHPILYGLIGGVGVVLFWRGVWHTADTIPIIQIGPISLLVGSLILLMSGVFVSAFVGNRLIMTGLKGDKKLEEMQVEEIETEEMQIQKLQKTVEKVENELKDIEKEIEAHHTENK